MWRAIRFVEHLTGDGPTVFRHVCNMGLEGIVSKRTDPEARACGQRDDFVQGRQYKIIIANSP
jgi:ATP-dependent DNA ligase